MNKKGNFLDWFYITAIFLMTGVCVFVAFIVVNEADSSGIFADYSEAQDIVNTTSSTILNFDNLMLFVIVGLSIFVLVSAAMVYNHPAFFITGVVLLFIAVTVAAMAANTFWIFSNQSTISATAARFPKLTFIMENMPLYVAFMGIAAAICAYISFKRE